ncbi:MAG TPA: YraN family protein [Candidatus Paceibacterota bacterium]|nr:YraN family protein [Candidatus Paceibacterota bacterium]
MSTKEIGTLGESIAATFLERKGYRILERNYRKTWGEVDIVAERRGVVRFVEVKSVSRENSSSLSEGEFSRETGQYRPEEQVHPEKLRKISRLAENYMVERHDGREYQIDVVGVFLDHAHRRARCRLFENAIL